jgi:hypothetical protein
MTNLYSGRMDGFVFLDGGPVDGAKIFECDIDTDGPAHLHVTLSVVPGRSYAVTVWAKRVGGGAAFPGDNKDQFFIHDYHASSLSLGTYLTTGVPARSDGATFNGTTFTDMGNGWWKVTTTWTPEYASSRLEFRIWDAVNDDRWQFTGMSVQSGPEQAFVPTAGDPVFSPRITHDKDGTRLGYLHEPQRTNLTPNGNKLTGPGWQSSNVTATEDSSVSPDGSNTASLLEVTSSAYARYEYTASDLWKSKTVVGSCYVKAAATSRVGLAIYGAGGGSTGNNYVS